MKFMPNPFCKLVLKNPVDNWKEFAKTIDALENPVFAINKAGVILAWNKAMEQLTGFDTKAMMHKGNREYAIPFYGEPRPMLVDYIVMSDDKTKSGKILRDKTGREHIYR